MIEPKGCPMPGGCACPDPSLLPEEIAGLIATAKKPLQYRTIEGVDVPYHPDGPIDDVLEELADTLQQQAQEIERLKDDLSRVRSVYDFAKQAARIAELEAERDEWHRLHQSMTLTAGNALKERDAIRAKTIEDCAAAKIVIPQQQFATASGHWLAGFQAGAEAQIDAIRAFRKESP